MDYSLPMLPLDIYSGGGDEDISHNSYTDNYQTDFYTKIYETVNDLYDSLMDDEALPNSLKQDARYADVIINDFTTIYNILVEYLKHRNNTKHFMSTFHNIIVGATDEQRKYYNNVYIHHIENTIADLKSIIDQYNEESPDIAIYYLNNAFKIYASNLERDDREGGYIK
jgi:ABC-type transporter MlaC component